MSSSAETVSPSVGNSRRPEELAHYYEQITPGSQAEEDLVQRYLPLVKTVVARLAMTLPRHLDAEDMYSAGLIGLLNAVRNFDPRCGTAFASYARVRIRGAVLDELRRLDWVPRSVHSKARQVQAVLHKLEQVNGEVPSEPEMAKALNLSLSEYEELLLEIRPATFICLDAVGRGEEQGEDSRHESIPDESQEDPAETATRHEITQIIIDRIERLPEVQRKVLALYYFEDMRLREIAEAFGVTEARISQIHAQAILSIRAYLQSPELQNLNS